MNFSYIYLFIGVADVRIQRSEDSQGAPDLSSHHGVLETELSQYWQRTRDSLRHLTALSQDFKMQ